MFFIFFRFSGLSGEIVSVFDISSSDSSSSQQVTNLGTIGRMGVSDLVSRGVTRHTEHMKLIAANAMVESSIENTVSRPTISFFLYFIIFVNLFYISSA